MTISDSPVPPWRQLLAILTRRIEDGTYPRGTRVPSIAGLAQEFGLAESTVQKALRELKEAGLIETSVMGTFVSGESGSAPSR